MTFEQWEAGVPELIKADTVWRVRAYRFALFLSDLAWHDADKLLKKRRTLEIGDQLFRATAKISASLIEGYSRDTSRGRAVYYEYALGSARESRDWYYKARFVLREEVVAHRISLCTDIIRLTLKMIATERRSNRRVSAAA